MTHAKRPPEKSGRFTTAVCGIVSAALNVPDVTTTYGELRALWIASSQRWERAMAKLGERELSIKEIEQLDQADAVITEKETKLATYAWLVRRAEDEACLVLNVQERRP